MKNHYGIFQGFITVKEEGGKLMTTIDGASDATGIGEALGTAAAGWLSGTPDGPAKAEMFRQLLVAFVACAAASEITVISGTQEMHRYTEGGAMATIDAAMVRRALKLEKKNLRKHRKQDFEANRARFSAASEDAVSRVLMLEELLDGSAGEEQPASAD